MRLLRKYELSLSGGKASVQEGTTVWVVKYRRAGSTAEYGGNRYHKTDYPTLEAVMRKFIQQYNDDEVRNESPEFTIVDKVDIPLERH